jgi:hypothetical protein
MMIIIFLFVVLRGFLHQRVPILHSDASRQQSASCNTAALQSPLRTRSVVPWFQPCVVHSVNRVATGCNCKNSEGHALCLLGSPSCCSDWEAVSSLFVLYFREALYILCFPNKQQQITNLLSCLRRDYLQEDAFMGPLPDIGTPTSFPFTS